LLILGEQTIADFNGRVLPSITQLYQSLATGSEQVCEAEALIGALIEEIEDVADDVREAKALSEVTTFDTFNDTNDQTLRSGLLNLLKSLVGMCRRFSALVTPNFPVEYRAADAPPLVLLDDSDITAELRSVASRVSISEPEGEWSSHLTGQLFALFVIQIPCSNLS
jgi:hypothetical protein